MNRKLIPILSVLVSNLMMLVALPVLLSTLLTRNVGAINDRKAEMLAWSEYWLNGPGPAASQTGMPLRTGLPSLLYAKTGPVQPASFKKLWLTQIVLFGKGSSPDLHSLRSRIEAFT